MTVQPSDIQTAADVTTLLGETLPAILTGFGLSDLVPLVGIGASLEKLIADLISQKQVADNPAADVASIEDSALADLRTSTEKP